MTLTKACNAAVLHVSTKQSQTCQQRQYEALRILDMQVKTSAILFKCSLGVGWGSRFCTAQNIILMHKAVAALLYLAVTVW